MLRQLINSIFFPKRTKRKKIYEWMLQYFKTKTYVAGLCIALKSYYETFQNENYEGIGHFPELMTQRPTSSGIFWWEQGKKEPRIKALEKAIKLCK